MIEIQIRDEHLGEESEVVRIILALSLLLLALALFTMNGCGNNGVPSEEIKIMTESNILISGGNMNAGYKTATFALG